MVNLFAAIELPVPVPVHLHVTPDWRLLLYATLLTALVTVACGLLPAWQSLKVSVASHLARERKSRLRGALVAAQIAVSVLVLCTGFLFVRNLISADAINLGFDVQHTLHVQVDLPPGSYSSAQRRAQYINNVLRGLEALPGTERAAAAVTTPFNGMEGFAVGLKFPDTRQEVSSEFRWNAVTSGYFRAMDIPVYAGRSLSEKMEGEREVVVNRVFAERYLRGRNGVGTVFSLGDDGPYRVVGIVGDTKTWSIGEEPQAQLYRSFAPVNDERLGLQLVARSLIPPVRQLEPMRRALHEVDPMVGAEVETMSSSTWLALFPSQVGAALFGSIGVLGLLLATIGLYAVIGYSVIRRTREIGIRIAIGANRRDISKMVLREAAGLTLIGSAVGLFTAIFITRPLAIFLVPGLKPADPLTFSAVVVVMILTGVVAALGPTRRALKIDPNSALRYE